MQSVMHVSRDKITYCHFQNQMTKQFIISPAYHVFEVKDTNELDAGIFDDVVFAA
jgi:hypothetical protein